MTFGNSKKIALISPFYPPPLIGGSKVYIHNLVENSSFNFEILTSPLKANYKEITSPRHRIYRSRYVWDQTESKNPTSYDLFFSYAYSLYWLVKKSISSRYDAVIVNVFPFANGFFFILGKLLKLPIVGIGYAEEFTLPAHGKGFKNFLKRRWIRLTHRHASGFVVVCRYCRSLLAQYGVPRDKIKIIPPCLTPNKINQIPLKTMRGYNILSVGRIIERKGFHFLIESIDRLKDKMPKIHLTIVGDGPYRERLIHKIQARNLGSFVSLVGSLTDQKLSELYHQSDLFVLAHFMLPNGDTEGSPLVFIEASACGLPVIGGIEGGASTVIDEGKTGFTVAPQKISELADCIEKILSNPALAEKMRLAGIAKVHKELSPQKMGADFLTALNELVFKFSQGEAF